MEIKRDAVIIAGEPGGFAKATRVIANSGFVFLSGSIGQDVSTGEIPAGIGAQMKLALENIKARLEEFGTSLKNIVRTRWYVVGEFPNGVVNDPKFSEMWQVKEDFWKENCPEFVRGNRPPTSTLLGVRRLALPELLLEVEVIAAVE